MSINIAEQLEENEQFEKAYEEYKKILVQRPKSLEILERLGHLAVILDEKEDAIDYYSKILELDATSILAYEQLMDLYVHTDRYKYYVSRGNLHVVQQELSHAINDFKKALDKAQTSQEITSVRFVLANLYEQTGKSHPAIDEYLRILDTQSANEFVYLKLAKIYFSEGAVSSAIEILERARSNDFDTNEVKENLAQLYLKNNEPQKAMEITENDLVKVKSLLEEEKNKEAFELLEKVDADTKKTAQYHSLLAQYYFNEKQFDKSLESVVEFDKLEPSSPLAYQMRALIFEEKGEDYQAHINWAKYNLSRKDKDVALNEYMSAYRIKSNEAEIVKEIAELLEELNDKNHAAEFYEKLAELDPMNKKALQRLADFKESIGDYRGEAEFLEKLYDIDKKNALLVKNLAKTYEKIKNKEKALKYYNKFISISPVSEDYEEIKLKIQKLEGADFQEEEGLIDKFMRLFSKK